MLQHYLHPSQQELQPGTAMPLLSREVPGDVSANLFTQCLLLLLVHQFTPHLSSSEEENRHCSGEHPGTVEDNKAVKGEEKISEG